MKTQKDNKHIFALFINTLADSKNKTSIVLSDKDIIRRISSVLRLKEQDQIVLFSQSIYAECFIKTIEKKSLTLTIKEWKKPAVHSPKITVFLPLLKRDAFETALYNATALGVTEIQLIHTEKTRKWSGEKEYIRLQRIIISAAEQSKNYAFPLLKNPMSLEDAISKNDSNAYSLCADVNGDRLSTLLPSIKNKKSLVLLIGPEGDFTTEEKKTIKLSMTFCKLTPTVLKSEHALTVLIGCIRTLL